MTSIRGDGVHHTSNACCHSHVISSKSRVKVEFDFGWRYHEPKNVFTRLYLFPNNMFFRTRSYFNVKKIWLVSHIVKTFPNAPLVTIIIHIHIHIHIHEHERINVFSYIRNSPRIQNKNAQHFVRYSTERVINDPENIGYWEKVRLSQGRRLPGYSRTKFLLLCIVLWDEYPIHVRWCPMKYLQRM